MRCAFSIIYLGPNPSITLRDDSRRSLILRNVSTELQGRYYLVAAPSAIILRKSLVMLPF